MKNLNVMVGADPFILTYQKKYYLFATCLKDGFKCYSSTDLINWKDEGYALKKGPGVLGDKGFWAPEIMYHNGLFYMIYVANEHLSIATSKSPTGPYLSNKDSFIGGTNMIDGHFYVDNDGTIYLYYVKFTNGNVIYVAKMNENLDDIIQSTEHKLIEAESGLEIISGYKVAEGPFLLKHNNKYYLTYSCNHFMSPYYAINLALSDNPLGPFVKYKNNPIFAKDDHQVGVGHHSFFKDVNDNHLMCVYHRHYSSSKPEPRIICITDAYFEDDTLVIDK